MACKRNANFSAFEAEKDFLVLKDLIFFHSQTFGFHSAFSAGPFFPFFLCALFIKSNNIDICVLSAVTTHVHVHAFGVLC